MDKHKQGTRFHNFEMICRTGERCTKTPAIVVVRNSRKIPVFTFRSAVSSAMHCIE